MPAARGARGLMILLPHEDEARRPAFAKEFLPLLQR